MMVTVPTAMRAAAILACLNAVTLGSDVVLPAPTAKGTHVAAVMLEGALIDAAAYTPLLAELQRQCGNSSHPAGTIALWAAAPQYPLSTVNPADIAGGIKRVLASLTAAGMPNGTRVFLLGHSLGGAMLDLYIHDNPAGFSGAIFMGSFIGRSRRAPATGHVSYPVPSLTLAGELDGLSRVTRTGAEAFYAQVRAPPKGVLPRFRIATLCWQPWNYNRRRGGGRQPWSSQLMQARVLA